MPTRDTFRYREVFEGKVGPLPGEIAPRLVLIHDFPAGPAGLSAPRAGAGFGLGDLQRYFSDGEFDYGIDFAEVYSRQTDGAATPGAIDVYRLVRSGAAAATGTFDDGDSTSPVDIGEFESVGPGSAYNKDITLEVVRVIDSPSIPHPAGTHVPVFNVTIPSPNPSQPPEIIRGVVFTEDGADGTSAYHRTIDAASITDRSLAVNFTYDPAAGTADLSGLEAGDIITVAMTGGSNGSTSLDDDDYEAALDDISGLPFRWRCIANLPNATVRAMLHTANKAAPFGHAITYNLYGETPEDVLTTRGTMGSEADDGRSSLIWGWGSHPNVNGREVPYAAGYFGRYSAKINAAGMGGEYPVGNLGLGFTTIAAAHKLTAAQEEALAQKQVMFARQLTSGSYAVHGSWTLDNEFDRMGDLGTRIMWNDVIRRVALVAEPLAHNRGATIITQSLIRIRCDLAIRPYVSRGYLKVANTGVSAIEDAAARFPGLSFPQELQGWVAYLAQLIYYPTLQGIFAHFTDADILGLASLLGGSAAPSGDAPAEE